jgi:hypothetical protein
VTFPRISAAIRNGCRIRETAGSEIVLGRREDKPKTGRRQDPGSGQFCLHTVLNAVVFVAVHGDSRNLIIVLLLAFGRPFSGVRLAFRKARLVGIEAGLDRHRRLQPGNTDGNEGAMNLCQRNFAVVECVGDAPALPE